MYVKHINNIFILIKQFYLEILNNYTNNYFFYYIDIYCLFYW